jgi:hypothetical protein
MGSVRKCPLAAEMGAQLICLAVVLKTYQNDCRRAPCHHFTPAHSLKYLVAFREWTDGWGSAVSVVKGIG